MNVRELLASHKEIDDRINLGLEEIAELRSLAERVTQRFSPDVSHGSGGHSDRVGSYAAKIADLEIRIDREIDRLVDLREQIMSIIAMLDDSTERMVLERYYILHEAPDTIADKLCYSRRHISRLHRKAVDKLEKLLDGDKKSA